MWNVGNIWKKENELRNGENVVRKAKEVHIEKGYGMKRTWCERERCGV